MPKPLSVGLVEAADDARTESFGRLAVDDRSRLGQFGTPAPVARLMASMLTAAPAKIDLLDAGAGVGSLTAAAVDELCRRGAPPAAIRVTAVEAEAQLLPALRRTLEACRARCDDRGVAFEFEIVHADFIEYAVQRQTDLLGGGALRFNCAIQNPPYHKIKSSSRHRLLLRRAGIEVSNLYAAFVGLTCRVLVPGGELVAITPRSFCNGPYFQPFRSDLLARMSLRRVHVFDSRKEAFGGDGVLQENVIIHGFAGEPPPVSILITTSSGDPGSDETVHDVSFESVVAPADPMSVMNLLVDGDSRAVVQRMQRFSWTLQALGVEVSTGRVVDFRAKPYLRGTPGKTDAPLIYPVHLRDGVTRWPVAGGKKPNGIANERGSQDLLVPAGRYVLVKRFSSKEQRRRIDAALYDSAVVRPDSPVGFENHLNYFHRNGEGLEEDFSIGLCVYLNSTMVDLYFRLFSGHTQVNATDLRSLPYPAPEELQALGRVAGRTTLDQEAVDELFEQELLKMVEREDATNPVASVKKVQEALDVLKDLGLPRAQQNLRSALTLLALLDLKRDTPWSAAGSPMLGITEMMTYFEQHFGKRYAPNTRETVRRQTVHQYIQAGLIRQNPDDPARPVNSGKNVYQVVPEALEVLRQVGTEGWADAKNAFLAKAGMLADVYARAREMERIPVKVREGYEVTLSPGGQNVLVKQLIAEFLPRFAPGAELLYVGDTEDKWAHFDESAFSSLGLKFDTHGKFPDVVAYDRHRDWLFLIEAVTSHGPVNAKRFRELEDLFAGTEAGRVYVTAFLTRKDLVKYLDEICWETEVWVAEAPGHMIHFDGKRFLGPYDPE